MQNKEQKFKEGRELLKKLLPMVTDPMRMKFDILREDDEELLISVDGYTFAIMQHILDDKVFTLDAVTSSMGGYWDPPDTDFVNILETEYVLPMIRKIIETVQRYYLDGWMERLDYEVHKDTLEEA